LSDIINEPHEENKMENIYEITAPEKKRLLTKKQETFCLKYFELGIAQQAAIAAGYSYIYARCDSHEFLRKPAIQARITELRKAAADASVATVLERKQRLTEIVRARLADFIDADGAPRLTDETANNGATAEYATRTRTDKDGNAVTEKALKLRDPVPAIQELNKMEAVYKESATVNITHNDIRIIEVRLAPGGEGQNNDQKT
jgi:phage terminase small subunit